MDLPIYSIEKPILSKQDLARLNDISCAMDKKDRYTGSHGRRVAEYAMRLARRLEFPESEIVEIGIGGLLHDVGKMGLSERIFSHEKEHLTEEMMAEVRRHPIIGATIIIDYDLPKSILGYVLYHHEREDGNGYPFGLRSEEIPAGVKIISIADCFDAVTTDRPYQKSKSIEGAFQILKDACDGNLCAGFVEAFIKDIEENGMVNEGIHNVNDLIDTPIYAAG